MFLKADEETLKKQLNTLFIFDYGVDAFVGVVFAFRFLEKIEL